VRELANVIEHAAILCEQLPLRADDLPDHFLSRRLAQRDEPPRRWYVHRSSGWRQSAATPQHAASRRGVEEENARGASDAKDASVGVNHGFHR
jgi:transcriptional regulator of acetoin/glycerol metabolism